MTSKTIPSTAANKTTQVMLNTKPHVKNEFGRLKTVVVSPPTFLSWDSNPINQWERVNAPPNIKQAIDEHKRMVEVMEKNGVNVVMIPPSSKLPEAVYTRDWGFVVGDKFFKANMLTSVRKPEPESIQIKDEIRFEKDEFIEGGDVVLPGNGTLFVGHGPRTNMLAIERLKRESGKEVIVFTLAPNELHLDCGLAVFPGGHALMYPNAFANPTEAIAQVKRFFPKIEFISTNAYTKMGANVQFLDEGTMLSGNSEIAGKLKLWGFNPIHMAFEEIHKGGGSYRCCTLPLVRE